MTNQTILPISVVYPPEEPAQIVPYKPPKKKRRTIVYQVVENSPNPTPRPKKPDPNAPKITRPCTECGKKFWSWKALFGHMRCHPERQWRGINPPPNLQRNCLEYTVGETSTSCSKYVAPSREMTDEDHEVATILLMLANGPGPEKEKEGAMVISGYDEFSGGIALREGESSSLGFGCSSCKKVFGSHQALGGHRASHKNVKGCFAIHRGGAEVAEDEMVVVGLGHKCSICFRVFSSGQALGGHKRCHFEKGGPNCLDLNLPAPVEDNDFNDSFSCYSSGLDLDLRLGI